MTNCAAVETAQTEIVWDRDDLISAISDTYKEIHGIRPRWFDFDSMTYEQLEAEAERMAEESERAWEQEKLDIIEAEKDHESAIGDMINYGAADRKTALRWMYQADTFYGSRCVESWLYSEGLSGSKRWTQYFNEIMEVVEFKS